MVKIGIVGGTGYTGVELLRILASHPRRRRARDHVARRSRHARRRHVPEPARQVRQARPSPRPTRTDLKSCNVVFFATPHGVAMAQARELVGAGVKIIDLAADFRIRDAAVFEKWYKLPHACPDLLEESVYGLARVPSRRDQAARIVGNPGCYPTAMQLGLRSAARGGRRRQPSTSSPTASRARRARGARRRSACCSPRPPTTSRPTACPAIATIPRPCRSCQGRSKTPVELIFTPHLLPMIRGIHATLYARAHASPTSTCRRCSRSATQASRSST